MRTLIVTAANEAFAPLLHGLIGSLQQWQPRSFTHLACFDLGLSPASRAAVSSYAEHVIEPAWDLDVDMTLRVRHPEWRALTVRPFLRDYFPGYDVYFWIDADAWVQERFALDQYLSGALRGALVVASHVHPAYQVTQDVLEWRIKRGRAYFGRNWSRIPVEAYFNAGVFALRADMPHWAIWADWFAAGLARTNGKLCCDQTALNGALWAQYLPVSAVSPLCNWLCHLAIPSFDAARARFCEPLAPSRPIGILHLTAGSKHLQLTPDVDPCSQGNTLRFMAR